MQEVSKEDGPRARLTIEQIRVLSDYCLQNASELVEEAKLLFENKKYARSFFLSTIALEEVSKRDVLWEAIFLGEDEQQWKKFWNKFRHHDVKLARMLKDYITIHSSREEKTPRLVIDEYLTEMQRAEGEAKEMNLAKQWAMYVDIVGSKVLSPPQVINIELSSNTLKLAQQHLEVHRNFKPTTQEIESRLSLKNNMKEGESFIDYWFRKHSHSNTK